jgi:anti-sigma factor RsiW
MRQRSDHRSPYRKKNMSRPSSDDNSVLLVHAHLDGELDPANALSIAQQISQEPALAAEAERVKELQQLIHDRLPREAAPAGLRARIESSVSGTRREPTKPSWRALAASVALAAAVASGSTWFVVGSQQQPTQVAELLVSDHIRSLMAPQPVDVVSTDRHTVKPWFNGRISNSPRVADLTKDDFPLIGGRVDVLGRAPVSTLVYRRAKHLISLTAVPAKDAPAFNGPRNINGYNIVRWTENGVSYWAISDVEPKELELFAQLFRTSQNTP